MVLRTHSSSEKRNSHRLHYRNHFPYQNEKWSLHIGLVFEDIVDWCIEILDQNEEYRP